MSKKDQKCKELDSFDAATDVADNFKQIKESMSNVVCQDEQLERKMSDSQETDQKTKADTRKTCQPAEHGSPKKDFDLHLKLPLCLMHVDIFNQSEMKNSK